MNSELPRFSGGFERLYCDKAAFDPFSLFHPISFARVLPFQSSDPVVDDHKLIHAEEAHLADKNDNTRLSVVEAYSKCGLLPAEEAANLKSAIGYYGADFFELMGLLYANAGMFICALRWYREFILELETQSPNSCSDNESVYAGVGYCLYSLGLFAEAVSWSKSCIGPRQTADLVCQALLEYEAELGGGRIKCVERSGPRIRYTVGAFDPAHSSQTSPRLKATMKAFAPFQDVYIDWISSEASGPEIQPGGYPFKAEYDSGSLIRHKMNLIFATCGEADALFEKGYHLEAKRLLCEAAMLEPRAAIVRERLEALS